MASHKGDGPVPKRVIAPVPTREGCVRLLQERDLDQTRSWRNRDEIRKWFRNTDPIAPSQHTAWFQNYLAKVDDYTFVIEHQGTAVGQIALYNLNLVDRTAEIGRIVIGDSSFAGRGLAREALEILLGLARKIFDLNQIYLEVRSENERAIALYRRCGFAITTMDNEFVKMSYRLPSMHTTHMFQDAAA
jgi:diamine N-acetyltransferase